MTRNDYPAAANLTERALDLVPDGEIDILLEVDHIDSLVFCGEMLAGGDYARGAVARARSAGDRVAELALELECGIWETFMDPHGSLERLEALAKAALPELEASGDDRALYVAWWCMSHVTFNHGQIVEQLAASERYLFHAQRLPSPHYVEWSTRASAMSYGPTPALELLAWLDENQPFATSRNHRLQLHRAGALAMCGRTDEAEALVLALREELRDRGRMVELEMTAQSASQVLRLAGDPEGAEACLAEACVFFEERNERSLHSTAAALRGLVLIELGRLEEAERSTAAAFELAAADDVFSQLPALQARARLLALRRDHEQAEQVARRAVEWSDATDLLRDQGDAYATLADVLARAGKVDEAAAAYEQAAAIYARKGDVVSERRVRELSLTRQPSERLKALTRASEPKALNDADEPRGKE